MSIHHVVPVFYGTPSVQAISEDLRQHGLVVIEEMRTGIARIAKEIERDLGVDAEVDRDDQPFLLHLSAPVEPVMVYGWIDYLVYSESFDGCPLKAKSIAAAAVRSWKSAGQPDYHLARIRS